MNIEGPRKLTDLKPGHLEDIRISCGRVWWEFRGGHLDAILVPLLAQRRSARYTPDAP